MIRGREREGWNLTPSQTGRIFTPEAVCSPDGSFVKIITMVRLGTGESNLSRQKGGEQKGIEGKSHRITNTSTFPATGDRYPGIISSTKKPQVMFSQHPTKGGLFQSPCFVGIKLFSNLELGDDIGQPGHQVINFYHTGIHIGTAGGHIICRLINFTDITGNLFGHS